MSNSCLPLAIFEVDACGVFIHAICPDPRTRQRLLRYQQNVFASIVKTVAILMGNVGASWRVQQQAMKKDVFTVVCSSRVFFVFDLMESPSSDILHERPIGIVDGGEQPRVINGDQHSDKYRTFRDQNTRKVCGFLAEISRLTPFVHAMGRHGASLGFKKENGERRKKPLQTRGFLFTQRPRRGGRVVEGAPLLRE